MLDGEYKVMGMAPYGDPAKFDFSPLLGPRPGHVRVDTRLVNTVGLRRYKEQGRGFFFSPGLVRRFGPRRRDDAVDQPYVDYAAAMQRAYEEACLALIDRHLAGVLAEGGQLAFAGGGALNVRLNQRILARPDVASLFVQPAAGDAGTALGAATFAASAGGENIAAMDHVFLGPAFSTAECRAAARRRGLPAETLDDAPARAARIVADGHPLAWFQGRMEFGPRALGSRSILGCPRTPGIADRINAQIKYRERWRPFCPSMTAHIAPAILGSDHPAPFMTIAFDVAECWRRRIPEVVHVDGTARVQVVTPDANPRYYALLERLGALTGVPVALNTSLNRRGEPIACTPDDALDIFEGSDLRYLVMEDVLVTKRAGERAEHA